MNLTPFAKLALSHIRNYVHTDGTKPFENTPGFKLVDKSHISRRALGQCDYSKKTIYIYSHGEFDEREKLDTLLHEIAHHVTHCYYGHTVKPHGRQWRSICEYLGGKPRAATLLTTAEKRKIPGYLWDEWQLRMGNA